MGSGIHPTGAEGGEGNGRRKYGKCRGTHREHHQLLLDLAFGPGAQHLHARQLPGMPLGVHTRLVRLHRLGGDDSAAWRLLGRGRADELAAKRNVQRSRRRARCEAETQEARLGQHQLLELHSEGRAELPTPRRRQPRRQHEELFTRDPGSII